MNLDRYDYETSVNYFDYEFNSEGPKGIIRKIICFFYYNLAFGNLNKGEKKFDDSILSNNEDAEKSWQQLRQRFLIDHSNDPFVGEKIEASKKVIMQYGLPKSFVRNRS